MNFAVSYKSEYCQQNYRSQVCVQARRDSSDQVLIGWASGFALVGLALIIIPFIKPLRKTHASMTKIALAALPAVALMAIGLAAGFFVTPFSCYKTGCSIAEGSAIFWIPLATLFFTIPAGVKIYKSLKPAKDNRNRTVGWIIAGLIFFGISSLFLARIQ